MINCAFTFSPTNAFGWFCSVMAQIKLVKHVPELDCHTFIFVTFKSLMKWSTICQYTNYHNTALVMWYMCDTCIYQNIARVLTYFSSSTVLWDNWKFPQLWCSQINSRWYNKNQCKTGFRYTKGFYFFVTVTDKIEISKIYFYSFFFNWTDTPCI